MSGTLSRLGVCDIRRRSRDVRRISLQWRLGSMRNVATAKIEMPPRPRRHRRAARLPQPQRKRVAVLKCHEGSNVFVAAPLINSGAPLQRQAASELAGFL